MHLATCEALPVIQECKAAGAPLTVETTHHYLSLAAEDIPNGATQYKCCPPIRDARNQVWNPHTFVSEPGNGSNQSIRYLPETQLIKLNNQNHLTQTQSVLATQ